MRKERRKPPQVRPGILVRLQLRWSTGRHVDGLWIGSWRTPQDLPRIERALLLVKNHSPLHYSRIVRELERVWIFLLPAALGGYDRSLKACMLDERYVANSATSIEEIASTIVHEATHAKLDRRGFGYQEELRARIEAICFRRELAFSVRLPAGAQLQKDIAYRLTWYQSNPDYFGDAQFRERDNDGVIEMLRHIGAPDWIIRATPKIRAMVSRTRRLLRLAWPRRGSG